jgi:hypothetical protein
MSLSLFTHPLTEPVAALDVSVRDSCVLLARREALEGGVALFPSSIERLPVPAWKRREPLGTFDGEPA